MTNIDISVIIPARNTGSYLKKCINSMINQTASNIEIIIVDDASDPPLKSLPPRQRCSQEHPLCRISITAPAIKLWKTGGSAAIRRAAMARKILPMRWKIPAIRP